MYTACRICYSLRSVCSYEPIVIIKQWPLYIFNGKHQYNCQIFRYRWYIFSLTVSLLLFTSVSILVIHCPHRMCRNVHDNYVLYVRLKLVTNAAKYHCLDLRQFVVKYAVKALCDAWSCEYIVCWHALYHETCSLFLSVPPPHSSSLIVVVSLFLCTVFVCFHVFAHAIVMK